MKEKLKSKVVWLTAIPLIANLVAVFVPSVREQFITITTTIVTLLALFGILNNPDNREGF